MALRFTAQEIADALRRAGVDEDAIHKVALELLSIRVAHRKKAGRPAEDDAERLAEMKELVAIGWTRWAATGQVTEDLQEPARSTARKRLLRKSR